MIHTQWIHRNGVVHKRKRDGLKVEEGKRISEIIKAALEGGASDLEDLDRYLLDYTLKEIDEWTGTKKAVYMDP